MAEPASGVCTPWLADLDEACCSDPAKRADAVTLATALLYRFTGRQYPGVCERIIRPCSASMSCATVRGQFPAAWDYAIWDATIGDWTVGPSTFPVKLNSNWYNMPVCGGNCFLPRLDRIPKPIVSVTEIIIDGAILAPSAYKVEANRAIVRLDGHGWPCFPAGTLILTSRGLVPIEDVHVGDRVHTHKNRWRTVTRAGKTGDSEIVAIKGRGGVVRCTPDHQFWARETYMERIPGLSNCRTKLGATEWREASQMVGWTWATPAKFEPLPVPLPEGIDAEQADAAFWWMVGRWVGDGWTAAPAGKKHSKRVFLCCGHHEAEYLDNNLRHTPWEWRSNQQRTSTRFWIIDKGLWTWLREHFGVGATRKRIPVWLLGASKTIRQNFLDGYVSADGCSQVSWAGSPFTSLTTVSKNLAIGTRYLVASLGWSPVMYEVRQSSRIEGRDVNVHQPYRIDWQDTKIGGRSKRHSWLEDDQVWGRVRSVEIDPRIVPVYDLEVEEDHSFVADGFVVHNCSQQFSGNSGVGGDVGTWQVKYMYGRGPGADGEIVCALFACEIAKFLCSSPCQLPQRLKDLTREGVGVVLDPLTYIGNMETGIPLVDEWINSVNPGKLQRRSTIRRLDQPPTVGALE